MQNLRNKLIAGGAVVILAAIGTVMNRQAAQAQGGPTVTIAGTPNVNVANTLAAPVPVLDVTKTASNNVQLECPPSPCAVLFAASPYVVPAGKYLVVTSVDILTLSSGNAFFWILNGPSSYLGYWQLPHDGVTHSFQYPSGIVFPPGFVFSNSQFSTTFVVYGDGFARASLRGYLTSQ
jgi:hypothetical protein